MKVKIYCSKNAIEPMLITDSKKLFKFKNVGMTQNNNKERIVIIELNQIAFLYSPFLFFLDNKLNI